MRVMSNLLSDELLFQLDLEGQHLIGIITHHL